MKRCPVCNANYPDTAAVCAQDGNPLVPSPEAAKPKSSLGKIFLFGCLGLVALFFVSCGVILYLARPTEEQKKQQEAEHKKFEQEWAATESDFYRKLAMAYQSFPPERARKEATCDDAAVTKASAQPEAGGYSAYPLHVDYDFLAQYAKGMAPADPEHAPGWNWLTGADLRNMRPGKWNGMISARKDGKRNYLVVFRTLRLVKPSIADKPAFHKGVYEAWAAIYDLETGAVIAQGPVGIESSDKVKYRTEHIFIETDQDKVNLQKALDDDFRDQFRDGLKSAVAKLCPPLKIDPDLP